MDIEHRLPPGFVLNYDTLDYEGSAYGTLIKKPDGYTLIVEVMFVWDHGFPGELPDDAYDRFEQARKPVIDAWTQLGGIDFDGMLFGNEPLCFLDEITWYSLSAEQVLELLTKGMSLERSVVHVEPGRVTGASLSGRYPGRLSVSREDHYSRVIRLTTVGEDVPFASWDVAAQDLRATLPVRVPSAHGSHREEDVAAEGASLAAALAPMLGALPLRCLAPQRVAIGDGWWWAIPVARGCETMDDIDAAMREMAAFAHQVGEAWAGAEVEGPLLGFLAEDEGPRA